MGRLQGLLGTSDRSELLGANFGGGCPLSKSDAGCLKIRAALHALEDGLNALKATGLFEHVYRSLRPECRHFLSHPTLKPSTGIESCGSSRLFDHALHYGAEGGEGVFRAHTTFSL